jgi:hypothetical protein
MPKTLLSGVFSRGPDMLKRFPLISTYLSCYDKSSVVKSIHFWTDQKESANAIYSANDDLRMHVNARKNRHDRKPTTNEAGRKHH